MDFPIQPFMDENACYHFLLDLVHPEGLHCPRCHAHEGFIVHRYYREPVLDYRCPACGRVFNAWTGTVFQGTVIAPRCWSSSSEVSPKERPRPNWLGSWVAAEDTC